MLADYVGGFSKYSQFTTFNRNFAWAALSALVQCLVLLVVRVLLHVRSTFIFSL